MSVSLLPVVWLRFMILADALPAPDPAAVFQYVAQVPVSQGRTADAFLWIPPRAPRVRGVLMAGMTLAERALVTDQKVRQVSEAEGLAIVFLKKGLASVDIQRTLDALAASSGYQELSAAPLFFVGHSAGGPQAKAAAAAFADRCFGLMQFRGGAPSWDVPLPPGVPALMMIGQFDEFGKDMMRDQDGIQNWMRGRDDMARFRAANVNNLGSIVVEPGAGHFAWSERSAAYFALFLRKAARARIPQLPARPGKCKPVDAASGWLTDLAFESANAHAPASAAAYRGDKARAAWHFDRELAEATVAIHRALGKRDQFIRWKDPVVVEEGARFFFTTPPWRPTRAVFDVQPVYADIYPGTQPDGKGPRWALAGQPVGHSGAPIRLRALGGPLAAAGDHTLAVRFDALAPVTETTRASFVAYSEGDAEYRLAEHVGMFRPGFVKPTPTETVTFTAIPDRRASAPELALTAASDSGWPVHHYVAFGPAVVTEGKLRIAELPRRAQFPVQVRVVAYALGADGPKVAFTEQTFRIVGR